jgi:hypothetical protein
MGSYSTLCGSKLMPELLLEDVETFVGQKRVIGSIRRQISLYPGVLFFSDTSL